MNFFYSYALVYLFLLGNNFSLFCVADPTDGFTNIPLKDWNFKLQKPYDIPLDERYSFQNGVHKLWVYADDKPHDPNSHTQPRTEIRITVQSLSLSVLFW